jgi:hypothetical protein
VNLHRLSAEIALTEKIQIFLWNRAHQRVRFFFLNVSLQDGSGILDRFPLLFFSFEYSVDEVCWSSLRLRVLSRRGSSL